MSSHENPRRWKQTLKICLGCILALDALLVYVDWRARNSAPQAQAAERVRLAQKAVLLRADVVVGRAAEKQLPEIQKDCDLFYQRYLLSSSAGYSVIVADLGKMASDSGVQPGGVNFHQSQVKDSDLTEITITAAVQGDYQGLVRFINDLERSPHFYVLDGLTLASGATGPIKLNLSLRTYFRA
ncbi:MAG TPA: hypothetical protein VJN21_12360 [Candidatus Acidoferrales bacterium]|nr:hypothetical protein [Candidatus Acidoferrales bacterium]